MSAPASHGYQPPEFVPALCEILPMEALRDPRRPLAVEPGMAITGLSTFTDFDALQRTAAYTLLLEAQEGVGSREAVPRAQSQAALQFHPPSLAALVWPAGVTAARIVSGVGYILPLDSERVARYVGEKERIPQMHGLTLYIVGRLGLRGEVSEPFDQEVSYIITTTTPRSKERSVSRFVAASSSLVLAAYGMTAVTQQRRTKRLGSDQSRIRRGSVPRRHD